MPGIRNRFLSVFGLMLCQQFTGTNSIGYYAPENFQTIDLSGTNSSLFATGIYVIVNIITTGLFPLFGVDQIGRRWPLILGRLWMYRIPPMRL